jgi:hypothetical protein
MATEVIESVTPPPSSSIDNLGMEQTATEVVATQVATELPVEATSGGRDVVAASSEQIIPPPPSVEGHEIEASAAVETPVPAAAQASENVAEVSMADAMSIGILEIIDPDTPDLPSNDRDIYEVVLGRMLAVLVESGVEASKSATPVTAASAEVAEPTNGEPMPGTAAAGQLTPGQVGVVGGPETSATSKVAKEVLREPATGAGLTLVTSSPPLAVVDSAAAEAPESSSL